MRILYITTIGGTMTFFRSYIKELIEAGHTVEIAANTGITNVPEVYNELGCKVHRISCIRKPFSFKNIKAVKEIKKIVQEGNFDLVHCHTPIAAACTRFACRKFRKNGVKVFYSAHGFHFYKGAPIKNWLTYYPVEKICAHFTDTIITINTEDYELAKKKLKVKCVEHVPGVGIDVKRFSETVVNKDSKRAEIGIPKDAFFILSVGELNYNKNHEIIIRALAELKDDSVHFGIAGKGGLRDYLITLANELGVGKNVHLLGYRTDIPELYKCADVCAFTSRREGLGLAAIEGMAAGLPLIVADNRGTRAYANDNLNAIVCPSLTNPAPYVEAIKRVKNDEEFTMTMREHNKQAATKYDVSLINEQMRKIYGI